MFWLALVAVLLAWKGSVYPEAAQIRRFLGMQAPAAAQFWWLGTGCIILLVSVRSAYVLLRRTRSGRGTGMKNQDARSL